MYYCVHNCLHFLFLTLLHIEVLKKKSYEIQKITSRSSGDTCFWQVFVN
jgi:hypothetical protein